MATKPRNNRPEILITEVFSQPARLSSPVCCPAGLPLNDALEPGSLEVVGFTQPSGVGRSGTRRWNTRRDPRTTPWVLADLDTELYRLPRHSSGRPGERWLGNGAARCYPAQSRGLATRPRIGEAKGDDRSRYAHPLGRAGHRMRRRELMVVLGGAMTAGRALRAQQKAMPVIGYLGTTSSNPHLAAYRQGLSQMGYFEGQNVAIEYRWAEGHIHLLPALAADLVNRKVDLIAAFGGIASTRAAKDATSTIPIVFLIGIDPVAAGLVANLARPGGHLTGVTLLIDALYQKRLELLTELVPQARVIALLVTQLGGMNAEGVTRVVQEAATARGLHVHVLNANSETEIGAAFEILIQWHAGAVLVSANPFFDTHREQLLALAARHAVPAMYAWRDFPAGGGLISYGASLADVNRQLGIYAGKIPPGGQSCRSSGSAAN
jgi:putative tryptophan/tyrosine transport system substrate-binding protein